MQLTSATQVLPNVWLLHSSGPSTPGQPAAPAPLALCLPVSPRSPQPVLALPALQPPGNCPHPGVGVLQGFGQPSLTPLSSPVPCAASPLVFGGAAGSSPFADGRPSLLSGREGQPGTPGLMQPPASPGPPAADVSERPKRPPPCSELEWLLSQLPPPSPVVQSSCRPVEGAAAPWQEAASLVQRLPPSHAQPLLQPVEPLPPPPPLPGARTLQPAPAPPPTAQAGPARGAEPPVLGGASSLALSARGAGPPGSAVLGGASSLALELPGGVEGQLSEQLLLSFLDGELLDMDDQLLDLLNADQCVSASPTDRAID